MYQFHLKLTPECISLPTKDSFLKQLIFQSEKLISDWVRWKAYFFENPDVKVDEKETFCFNTNNCPPLVKGLQPFESEFYLIISNMEFKKIYNQTLNEIGITANSSLAIVPSDKSSNFYKLNIDDYSNLIKKSIASDYKKTKDETIALLIKKSAEICRNLEIDDRVEKCQSSSAYILLKDHKPNILSKPECHLINPAKTGLRKISKQIIERITLAVKNVISINKWRNTQDVINWFSE